MASKKFNFPPSSDDRRIANIRSVSGRQRLLPFFLLFLTVVPVALLFYAIRQNIREADITADVNDSGSLRYRSLWVYARRIRAQNAVTASGERLPILALIAGAMPEEEERCVAAGMDAFLTKPLSPTRLYDAIERWTGKSGWAKIAAITE